MEKKIDSPSLIFLGRIRSRSPQPTRLTVSTGKPNADQTLLGCSAGLKHGCGGNRPACFLGVFGERHLLTWGLSPCNTRFQRPAEFVGKLALEELVVEPQHPLQNRQFQMLDRSSGPLFSDRFRFEKGKLGFSQGVIAPKKTTATGPTDAARGPLGNPVAI